MERAALLRHGKIEGATSEVGQTRTSERFRFMSAQVPQAEIQATQYDVAVVP
jgi:hypothetical protein